MIEDIIRKITQYMKREQDKVWYQRRYVQIVIIVFIAVLGAVSIITTAHKNNAPVEELEDEQHAPISTSPDGENAAIAPDDIEVVVMPKSNETMVTVSLDDTGRSDPFLPAADYAQIATLATPSVNDFYMIPPPDSTGYDQDAVDVVKTKVSGIMYDRYNPSAILNINDVDYLVRTGDVVNNYRVLAISPSTVTVQLGANTYRAGVGEMFSGEDMNYVNDGFGRARRR